MWDEIGMSRGYLMKEASRAQGFSLIEPRKGLVSMRAVLATSAPVSYIGLDASRQRVKNLLDDAALPLAELSAWYSANESFDPSCLDAIDVRDRFGISARPTFTRLPTLPQLENGAVDDAALLERGGATERRAEAAARTSTERIVASVWREVLRLDDVDVHRSFFELGGQSVLLVQVHYRLTQVLRRELTVVDLLRYPTVSALGKFLDSAEAPRPTFEKAAERAQKQRLAAAQQQQRKSIRRPVR